jgi:amino acid transporter
VKLTEWLFGRPLRSDQERQEQVGPAAGVPVLGLDALASAAYGPEAALTVLLPAGALASLYITSLTNWILLILLAVSLSYRQTITAYPDGGGSYTVATKNLGAVPGLIAASALCTDYILNVAVAISAGAAAIVSAIPALLPYTLTMCVGILAFLTVLNLRGIRTVGAAFMAPTYAFLGCLGIAIVIGLVKTWSAHGHPVPVVPPPRIEAGSAAVSTWLLLRAFASGCTAMTGVEAVSNAVPIFREPRVKLAQRTLLIIVISLGFLLSGVAVLARAYHLQATPPGEPGYQSVLSLLLVAVTGRGAFYYVAMTATLTVLALSANTSFADFPRVCRLLARDGYLPADFAHRGRRLVYSVGILVLAIIALVLLIVFRGITDRLIPLFAVGAFTAFTMSQLGMVFHWRRGLHERGARHALLINGAGALATAVALVIIIVSKFREGAWITALVIPAFVQLFIFVRRYHDRIERELVAHGPLEVEGLSRPIAVVPLRRLDRVARKGLRFGMTIAVDVYAVQVLDESMGSEDLTREWRTLVEEPAARRGLPRPRLVVVRSPYREFFGPFLDWLRRFTSEHRDRSIAVIIPELAHRRWYQFLINRRETLFKSLLLMHGGPQIVIANTPWYPHERVRARRGSRATDAREDAAASSIPAVHEESSTR